MDCFILSGASGSGKSTWIKSQIFRSATKVVSADSFFMKDGIYNFDPKLLSVAHGKCLRDFIEAVQEAIPVVVVDNTNTTTEEIAPYYSIAKAFEYKVYLVTLQSSFQNVHNVQPGTVEGMRKRISERRIPRFWDLEEL
jgi:predicted kinase